METLREQLSSLQHDIWAHWMKYLFSVSRLNKDGSYTIPTDKVERWLKQISLPYEKLSETEKKSDRELADKILHILQ